VPRSPGKPNLSFQAGRLSPGRKPRRRKHARADKNSLCAPTRSDSHTNARAISGVKRSCTCYCESVAMGSAPTFGECLRARFEQGHSPKVEVAREERESESLLRSHLLMLELRRQKTGRSQKRTRNETRIANLSCLNCADKEKARCLKATRLCRSLGTVFSAASRDASLLTRVPKRWHVLPVL